METRFVRAERTKTGEIKAWIVNASEGQEEKQGIRLPEGKNPYCLITEGEQTRKVYLKENEKRALRKAIEEVGA